MQQRRPTMPPPRLPQSVYIQRRITVFGGIGVVLALFIFAVVAISGGSTPPPPTTTVPVHHASTTVDRTVIGVQTLVFTDPSRTTTNYVTGSVTKGRTISIELRYPAKTTTKPVGDTVVSAPIAKRMAYPLIVFAPGYRLQPSDYAPLLDAWVRAGFLVAALSFPNMTYPASDRAYAAKLPHGFPEADLYDEPADIGFAVTSLERRAASPGAWIHGLVATKKIVLAGHSDGGSGVAAAVYDTSYAQSGFAVRAVAVLSGAEFSISNQSYGQPATGAVPLLVVQSAADLCEAPSDAVQLYNAIGAPKYFDELISASHLGAVNGADADATSLVERTTIAFFDQSLGIGSVTAGAVTAAGTETGVGSLVSVSTAAAIPSASTTTTCPSD